MKLKKKEGQNVDASVLLRRENKTLMGRNTRSNTESGIDKKDHSKTALSGVIPHMQPPNTITIADAKKCLLAGTRYGYLVRGSSRVIQI